MVGILGIAHRAMEAGSFARNSRRVMHPVARREGFVVRPLGTDVVVLGPDRTVHRLDSVAG